MNATFDANPEAKPGPSIPPGEHDVITRRELEGEFRYVTENIKMWRMSHLREHELMDTARLKAEAAVLVRMEGMNELRSQIDRERGNYVTRDMQEERQLAMTAQVTAIEKSLNTRLDSISEQLQAKIMNNEKNIADVNKTLTTLATRITVAATFIVGLFGVLVSVANFVWKR